MSPASRSRAAAWLVAAAVACASFAALGRPADAPAGGALAIEGVDHVGLNVPDVDVAERLFGELLGMHVVLDVRPAPPGAAWKRRFRWHASSRLVRLAMLQAASGERLELFQYAGPRVSHAQPHEDDAAATHVALRVRDLAAGLAVVRARGLRVLCAPVTNADGTRWFYFLTPWGAQLELVARPDPLPQPEGTTP